MTSIVPTFDFLEAKDVSRLLRKETPDSVDVHVGIFRIGRIPRLAVLDVECKEPEHLVTGSINLQGKSWEIRPRDQHLFLRSRLEAGIGSAE